MAVTKHGRKSRDSFSAVIPRLTLQHREYTSTPHIPNFYVENIHPSLELYSPFYSFILLIQFACFLHKNSLSSTWFYSPAAWKSSASVHFNTQAAGFGGVCLPALFRAKKDWGLVRKMEFFMPDLDYSPIASPSPSCDNNVDGECGFLGELPDELFQLLEEIPGSYLGSTLTSEHASPVRQMGAKSSFIIFDEKEACKETQLQDLKPKDSSEVLKRVACVLEEHTDASDKKNTQQQTKQTRKKGLKREREPSEGKDDHILRERQRRDDMSSKFSMLESLLPWRSKRDRTAIVDDAIQFVTDMQKTLHRLEKIAEENRHSKEVRKIETCSKSYNLIRCHENKMQVSRISPSKNHAGFLRPSLPPKTRLPLQWPNIAPPLETTLPPAGPRELNVHIESPDQVIIEIGCNPRPALLTNIFRALEELYLDVSQCNFIKARPEILCIIVAKHHPGCCFSIERITKILRSAICY